MGTEAASGLVIDAKSLQDSLKSASLAQGAACKRTAVENLVFKQTLALTSTVLR